MKISGQHAFKAPPPAVWDAICDPEALKACIPQCEKIERQTDTLWIGIARVRIGPVKVTFDGVVTLSNVDAPRSYTIAIEASGWVGKAHGQSHVRLEETAEGTLLHYDAEAHIGISLLDKAMNLANRVAAELADSFFTRLAAEVERRQTAHVPPSSAP